MALDLNFGGDSLLVAVCGTSSRFTQVTFVPGATVRICGSKAKLSIVIRCSAAAGAVAVCAADSVSPAVHPLNQPLATAPASRNFQFSCHIESPFSLADIPLPAMGGTTSGTPPKFPAAPIFSAAE